MRTDTLCITEGALGPLAPCTIAVKPLTILIGPQGSGKSLVAQMLYFFEEVRYLAAFVAAGDEELEGASDGAIVRAILDRLRSGKGTFATFASPRARVVWAPSGEIKESLTFSADAANRGVKISRRLRELVKGARASKREPRPRACFFPTERIVISQLRTAMAEKLLSLPLTFTLFTEWMDLASRTIGSRKKGQPSTKEAQWIADRGARALGGRVVRRGDQWKWRYGEKVAQQFHLDLASSGQRANWSLVYLAQALFELRDQHEIADSVTLFVEEPEIHLHPAAQVAVAEILAFLVSQGFRVVITTHSLHVLYALNNLVQASRLGDRVVTGAPEPKLRLPGDSVAVWGFGDGAPRSLVDPETGFIDEGELGRVSEDLTAGMNRIGAALPPEEA